MSRIHYKNYKVITLTARKLRRDSTSSEKVLWEELRGKKIDGFKFLRQHPIFYRIDSNWVEFFVADFYCSKLKLIIELDGPIHQFNEEKDKTRDEKLKERGFFVKRIKNEELIDKYKIISELKVLLSELRFLNPPPGPSVELFNPSLGPLP